MSSDDPKAARAGCRGGPHIDGEASITSAGESTLELLGRIRVGDTRAREVLFNRLYPRLTRWAHFQLPQSARDLKETGDLVNEALLRTLSNLDGFEHRHPDSLFGYLCSGVRNQIRDEIRRVKRRPASDGTVSGLVDSRPSQVEEAIGSEVRALYERALARLSEADRTAIHMKIELDFSHQEIAEALGKPSADAARMAVNRALIRLGAELAGLREGAGV